MRNLYDLFQKKVFNIEPGLERIKSALKEFSNPEKNFKSILVAGQTAKVQRQHTWRVYLDTMATKQDCLHLPI